MDNNVVLYVDTDGNLWKIEPDTHGQDWLAYARLVWIWQKNSARYVYGAKSVLYCASRKEAIRYAMDAIQASVAPEQPFGFTKGTSTVPLNQST